MNLLLLSISWSTGEKPRSLIQAKKPYYIHSDYKKMSYNIYKKEHI